MGAIAAVVGIEGGFLVRGGLLLAAVGMMAAAVARPPRYRAPR